MIDCFFAQAELIKGLSDKGIFRFQGAGANLKGRVSKLNAPISSEDLDLQNLKAHFCGFGSSPALVPCQFLLCRCSMYCLFDLAVMIQHSILTFTFPSKNWL